jgi:Tfp pilus assembly protein PilO
MRSLMPILLVALAVGIFYLHIDPRYEKVLDLQDQKKQYDEALTKAKDLENRRDELQTKFESLPRDKVARLERLIPDGLNTVKLITDISEIAGVRYGIPVRAFKVKEEAVDNAQQIDGTLPAKPYVTTAISFKAAASYENMIGFIADMERSLQLVTVQNVTFKADDGQNNGITDYEIEINTYSLR